MGSKLDWNDDMDCSMDEYPFHVWEDEGGLVI